MSCSGKNTPGVSSVKKTNRTAATVPQSSDCDHCLHKASTPAHDQKSQPCIIRHPRPHPTHHSVRQ